MADSGQTTGYNKVGPNASLTAKRTGIVVAGTGNTSLLNVPVERITRIAVLLTATVHALDAFVIKGQIHRDVAAVTLYSSSGSFTSLAGLLVGASGDLTALAQDATGWFIMDVRGLFQVEILASGAADGTLVDIYATGS